MTGKFVFVALIGAALLCLQVDRGAYAQPTAPDGQVNANQHYRMVQLDTCGDTCTVGGINRSCEVVGSYHQPAALGQPAGPQIALLWSPIASARALDNTSHGPHSPSDFVATAIDDDHVVVGNGSGPAEVAVRWNAAAPGSGSAWVEAPSKPGENLQEAWAINSSGIAVGRVKTSGSDAWLWSGQTYSLGDLHHSATNDDATAHGINDNGAIVGTGEADVAITATSTAANIVRAFYKSNQRLPMVDLGALAGGPFITHAAAINASGTIVGDSGTGTGVTAMHAVRWIFPPGSTTAQITDLGASSGLNTRAFAINAGGSIVGVSSGASANSNRAIGWAPNSTQAIDLTQQVTNANGLTIIEADGINVNGVIAGLAKNVSVMTSRPMPVVLIPTNRSLICTVVQGVPLQVQPGPFQSQPQNPRDRQPVHSITPPPH